MENYKTENSSITLLDSRKPPSVLMGGSNNTQIANIQHAEINVNVSQNPLQGAINPTYCNIIVLRDKNFTQNGGNFNILKSRVYAAVLEASDVRTYPSIFVTANDEYVLCTDPNQQFHYGFITAVEDEGENYKVSYNVRATTTLLQQKLNEIAVALGITPVKGRDILGETGWTIHQINIKKALEEAGIDMTIY